jgi:hypothetical protein
MAFQVNARLDDGDAFAFEELFLQGGIRLADEDFAALSNDAMPGNSSSRRSRGHGAPGAARAPRQTQSLSKGSIS